MRDFAYYIDEAGKAEKRSNGLWQCVNAYIRGVLIRCKEEGKTLKDAAEILKKSGRKKKGEPSSMSNLRGAARQIEHNEDLVLI